jgi:response regulator NasT
MDGAPGEAGRAATLTRRQLRVLVADEQREPLERTAGVARGLGHEVVALEVTADAVVGAVRAEAPQLAIVALHSSEEHAIDLIREIVDEGICPVIVQGDPDDQAFAARAAECGAFAFASPLDADALQAAVEVAVRRFEELEELSEQVENLEGALRRRAIVERAKGVVMERQGVDEREAFELLRDRARSSNRTVVDVAQTVLDGRSGLPGDNS